MNLFVSFNYSFYAISNENDIVIKLKGAMSFFSTHHRIMHFVAILISLPHLTTFCQYLRLETPSLRLSNFPSFPFPVGD